jgi:RNA polymerase sigma-70 factor, ECF subfamily
VLGSANESEDALQDSVGLALLVVLDALTPAERVAFVLHDVLAVPFADIATALDRSVPAAQQLASRARRRIRDAPAPDPNPRRQRRTVAALFAAWGDGDFDAVLDLLDPDVELRIDGATLRADATALLVGAEAVAQHTTTYAKLYPHVHLALVNGTPGAIVAPAGRLFSVMAFTVSRGRIARIDALVDPERLARLAPRFPRTQTSAAGKRQRVITPSMIYL